MLTLLATLTLAEEPTDLPGVARAWGFGSVAVMVRSANQGDRSLSDVHARLASMGLDRVVVPVEVDKGLAWVGVKSMSGCGWNQGVTCRLDLPPASGDERTLTAVCSNRKGKIDVPLSLVTDPAPGPATPGVAWIADLLPCWEAGGDRVRLVPAVAMPAFTVLINEGYEAAALTAWLAARGPALGGCGVGLALVHGEAGLSVKRDGKVDAAATACVKAAWGEGPGPGTKLVVAW
jgi:hypothetical protein